jgi:hypothetical protein
MPQDEPKIFQEKQTLEKCTQILREVKRFKIQVIIYVLNVFNDRSCSTYYHISTA